MSHCCNLVEMVHCLSMTYRHVVGDTFFSILKKEQAQSLKTEGRLCCDITISSYCESFVVLSSQRIKAAIIGVGQKGWPVAKTDDALIVCKRSDKKKTSSTGWRNRLHSTSFVSEVQQIKTHTPIEKNN